MVRLLPAVFFRSLCSVLPMLMLTAAHPTSNSSALPPEQPRHRETDKSPVKAPAIARKPTSVMKSSRKVGSKGYKMKVMLILVGLM